MYFMALLWIYRTNYMSYIKIQKKKKGLNYFGINVSSCKRKKCDSVALTLRLFSGRWK